MISFKSVFNLLALFSLVLNLCSCRTSTKTDYIFPPEYQGWALVVYNVKGANKCLEKAGRRQVVIPKSGVVFLSDMRPAGRVDNRYFILDKKKNKNYVYPAPDDSFPRSKNLYYMLATSYQSVYFNKKYYFQEHPKDTAITKSQGWVRYDELVVLKINRGYSNKLTMKDDLDKYIESMKKVLLLNNVE